MPDEQSLAEEPLQPLWWSALKLLLALAALFAIPLGCFAGFRLLHDWENVPLCHKQTWALCTNWWDRKRVSELPNIDGRSAESLAELSHEFGSDDVAQWIEKYQYVPGLGRGDPGDLVLMYMKKPTRWRHHAASPPSVFSERKWIVVPLDFAGTVGSDLVTPVKRNIPDKSECAERVSLEEFKSRLRKTLKYLQDNDRPNWQTVLAENEAFLNSLEADAPKN